MACNIIMWMVLLYLSLVLIYCTNCQPTSDNSYKTGCPQLVVEYNALLRQMDELRAERTNPDTVGNCADIRFKYPGSADGVYQITLTGGSHLQVYCDMATDGGGWLVFQRRQDGSENFYRNWADYQHGFGSIQNEFWIGNDNLHLLTQAQEYELRVDLEDFDGNKAYAVYSHFAVAGARDYYRLSLGSYSGTAGDSFSYHNGHNFSTFDADNDNHDTTHCAVYNGGGWWFNGCNYCHLNGRYLYGRTSSGSYIRWRTLRAEYSFKFTEMKIRPTK